MIEALIVVAILGVGLVTIFGMMLFGTTETVKLANNAKSINIATSTMELIRNYPYQGIFDEGPLPEVILAMCKNDNDVKIYEVKYRVKEFEGAALPDGSKPMLPIKRLRVIVSLVASKNNKKEGRDHKPTVLTTFIANQSWFP
jgi:hypothetical protein